MEARHEQSPGRPPIRWARLRRWLRSPRTIVFELVAVALAGVASTIVDQNPPPIERVRFSQASPLRAELVRVLGLDHVFTAWWFLALVVLAASSLAIVLVEQWRRLGREWRAQLSEASFRTAPYVQEFVRPARGAASLRIAVGARAGLLGSPLFHLGLMIVILAGTARTLFGADAVGDMYEGETLTTDPGAFAAQFPGPLAGPIRLSAPLTLELLIPDFYPSGDLRALSARVRLGETPSPRLAEIAINAPLGIGGVRVYLQNKYGVAAFVEVADGAGVDREVIMLEEVGGNEFRGSDERHGVQVRLRARRQGHEGVPGSVDVRVLRVGGPVAEGKLAPGEVLPLPGGGRVRLSALRWWARMGAARDLSAWPAYVGFALAGIGAILIFVVVKLDWMVRVHPEGDMERVVVALRAQRFAPLFRERFERIVRDEGGPPAG